MNQNCLHFCIETLFSKLTLKLRTTYYEPYALVRDEEAATLVSRLLAPFDNFPCELSVDTALLDVVRPLDPEDAVDYGKCIKEQLMVRCVFECALCVAERLIALLFWLVLAVLGGGGAVYGLWHPCSSWTI